MKDRHYTLTDETGDTLEVDTSTSSGSVFVTSGHGANVLLTRDQVAELRDYLTGWLSDQATDVTEDPMRDPGKFSRAHAMLCAAETVKATGGFVEISGVRIEACDEYGRTASDRAREDNRPTCCTGEDSSPCCPGPVNPTCARTDHPASSCQHDLDNVVPLRPVEPTEAVPLTILEEAQAAVYGDRQADYGHPRRNFTRTAIGWHMVLMDKLADGESITPEDVALCMVQVKVAREVHQPKRDNRVDGAGYFDTLDRLETGR